MSISLKPKFSGGNQESGISLLVVLIALMLFMLSMRSVFNNAQMSNKSAKDLSSSVEAANGLRFVNQVISDDQLCFMTDFMNGIDMDKVSFTKPSADITLKNTGGLVDYSALKEFGLKTWPGGTRKHWTTLTTQEGVVMSGEFDFKSVVFVQSKDREVLKTKFIDPVRGAMDYIRIPVNVRDRGIINGQDVIVAGGIPTYIELKPVKSGLPPLRDPPMACYKDVSSRSLCLDIGGKFDPTDPKQKCQLSK